MPTSGDDYRKAQKMKKYHIYMNHFLAWATGGRFIMGEKISSIGIKPLGDRILTRNKVTKVWHIWKFPYEFDKGLTDTLQMEMRESYPRVDLQFHFICAPIHLNIENSLFISQRNSAKEAYEKFRTAFQSLRDTDQATGIQQITGGGLRLSFGKADVEARRQVYDSFQIATDAVTAGKAINYVHVFVYAQAPDNATMNRFSISFRTKLLGLGVNFKSISSMLSSFLENYGPAAYAVPGAQSHTQAFLLRDNLTELMPTSTEGLVNDEGILLGVNVNSGYPFLLEFFKSGHGQTCMLLAKPGWGKTHLGFQFVLGLLGVNTHASVIDLKGNEWNKIGEYTEYLEISLSGASPRGVNTLRLDDMQAGKDDCVHIFNSAVDATVMVLSLMSEVAEGDGKGDLEKALRLAILTLYNKHGVVKENPDTFVKTRYLKYEDVLPLLAEMELGTETMPESVKRVCNIARFRCESVLKESGTLSEAFKNEISVKEIIDVPLVIFSLNKNDSQNLTVAETISVFMAEYLSTKKFHFRRRNGDHSALVVEEVQRCEDAGGIVRFLSEKTTGSRSENVMILFLLNSLSKLQGPSFAPIKSNITTSFVGLLDRHDIGMMRDEFGCDNIYQDLLEINSNPGEYKNVFAVSYNTGYQHGDALIKAMMPKKMNDVLATRTIRG